MGDLYLFLAFLVVGVVSAAVGLVRGWRDRRRATLLRQFCLAKGWRYAALDSSLTARWTGPPFFQGSKRRARNVIRGVVGSGPMTFPFAVFDYTYATEQNLGDGKRLRQTHRYVVCSVTLPAFLPALQVSPEGTLTRLAGALDGADIELESEDFNRRFRVTGPDPKFACDVLSPRTMQLLLARRPVSFRIERSDVLSWEAGVLTPTLLLERVSTLTGFVEGIPSFVWRDFGAAVSPEGVAT